MGARWSESDGPSQDALCRDLSLGGCFLETTSPPSLDAVILVHLELPGLRDESGQPITAVIRSRVRWTTHEGVGVQFGMMGARETAALLELLAGAARARVA
jgi:hypothetical protein